MTKAIATVIRVKIVSFMTCNIEIPNFPLCSAENDRKTLDNTCSHIVIYVTEPGSDTITPKILVVLIEDS